ncbi:MAG: AEC family transporter [Pseudomonadota bacterium]
MEILVEVLGIVAPVFILAAIGFGWVRLGFAFDLTFVTRLAMTLSVPCLVFVALARAEIDPDALNTLVIATLAAYGAVAAVMLLVTLLFRLDLRTNVAPLIFGNTGNVGLPVALFAYGDAGLSLAVVVFAIMAIMSFTVGVWIVSGGGSPLPALKEPMVAAAVLGGLCLYLQWTPPDWAMNALGLIGQMGIPLMLITLGVAIARLQPDALIKATALSCFKLAVCAAIPFAVARYLALPPMATGVLVLQVAMPVAVTSYMLAEKYRAKAQDVAGLVVVSTLLSVFALPVLLALVI